MKTSTIYKFPLSENVNTQGSNLISHTSTDAVIDIAVLNSFYSVDELSSDLVTELNPHDLSFVDFIACFYSSPGGNFIINPSNKHFKPLSLVSQTYKTSDGLIFYWNLYNQCLKAYTMKHNISESLISANKKIMLTRETFNSTSLATNCGSQNVLSWDQVLLGLETSRQIKHTNDMDHYANIIFRINYVFHSKVLDINVSGIFSYRTAIPGYCNIYSNEDFCIPLPYSKKENSNILKEDISMDSYFLSSIKKHDAILKKELFKEVYISQDACTDSLTTPNILLTNTDEYEDYEEPEDDEEEIKKTRKW
jgi:hypothetical protein